MTSTTAPSTASTSAGSTRRPGSGASTPSAPSAQAPLATHAPLPEELEVLEPLSDGVASAVTEPAAARGASRGPARGLGARASARLRSLARTPGLVLAGLVVLLVLAWALVPNLFASGDPLTGVPADRLAAPSAAHPFGTDHLGRDVYTRVVHGTGVSLSATAVAVAIGLVVGSVLGLLAGFLRGWVDEAIGRVVDVLLAIPSLLLSLALITALGFGTVKVAIAVGVTSVAAFARVMRAQVLRTSTSLYVEAARAGGVRWHSVLLRHVLPNSAGPVLALTALEIGTAVLAIASLSFLGYGAPPPAPEWGSLVAGGRDYLATAWWLTVLPGLVIVALVLAVNRVGRALERTGEAR